MPRVGFETTISAGERPKTYALDRAATGTGTTTNLLPIFISFPLQLVLSVKFILFILTFSALLPFCRILLYFTNFVPMGFLTVT